MPFTTRAAIVVSVILVGLATLGLPRLVLDGPRVFDLPPGHPLPPLSDAVDAAVGGDDLLAVVVVDASGDAAGLLDAEGVVLIEEIRAGMERLAVFDGVRAVTTAALLAEVDGAVTAVRPLVPPPADEAGWQAARRTVLEDPFARDLLVGGDGRTAMVAGWLFRGTPEQALVRQATLALRDADFRGSEAGAAVQEQVNGARMAVALGEAQGPVDAEIGRRLTALADSGGSGGSQIESWRAAAQEDPSARALHALGPLLDGLALPDGHRAGIAGVAAVEAALTEVVPPGVRLGLLGLMVIAGLVALSGRRSPRDACLAAAGTGGTFAVTLGLFGLLGVPLHPLSALAALMGAAWAAGLLAARGSGRAPAPVGVLVCAALAAAPAGFGLSGAGAGLAPTLALGTASLFGLLLPVGPTTPAPASTPETPRWWSTQGAVALLALGIVGSWGVVAGIDAARLVSTAHPAGRATADLADGLGVAPPAFAVYRDTDRPRALAAPVALTGLRRVQDALEVHDAVVGTRSWSDFVSALHTQVSGAPVGSLPDQLALVEQYLLMFGQQDDVRALVSPDLALGVAYVRLAPGGGAWLGRLAERWPADSGPVALAGDGVVVALAARLASQRTVRWGGLSLGLALVLVMVAAGGRGLGPRRLLTDPLLVAGATLVALAVASRLLGAIAPAACLAGLTVLGSASLSVLIPRRQALGLLACVAIGAAPMLPSPALELRAFAAGLAAGCLAALLVRLGFSRAASPRGS